MKTLTSILFASAIIVGCTQQQARDSLQALPYGVAKGACKGSSNCTLTNDDKAKGGAKATPEHWYEDGYGRDERVHRPFR